MLNEYEPFKLDMSVKTLIVDDEPIARKVLREELELIDDVEVIGEAADGLRALEKIDAEQPDLVLLDLQMPAMGGLDVVRELKHGKREPVIVIVTAYDQHALEAFDAGAIDYLLKPFDQERFNRALNRALSTVEGERRRGLDPVVKLPPACRGELIGGAVRLPRLHCCNLAKTPAAHDSRHGEPTGEYGKP